MSEQRIIPNLESSRKCYLQVASALEQAVRTPGDPLRLFTIASNGLDGFPESRLVVLRGFDSDARIIEFHCDLRSPKVEQLRRDPRVTLLFYDHLARWQIRIWADTVIHHRDAIAEKAWRFSPTTSRGNYACPYASGDPVPEGFTWAPPTEVAIEDAAVYQNFVVVHCRIESIDVYVIHPDRHERAVLRWNEDRVTLTRVAI
jgi:pyridoxamine 5'-phosphate oxidase